MIGPNSEKPAMRTAGHAPSGSSCLQISPAFIVLAVAIGCANNFADPDLWMHILVGQRIVATGHIPMRDLYSYSALGSTWHNHEWLAEVVLGVSYRFMGVLGLKLVKLVCTTTAVMALAVGLARTAASPRVQRMVLLAAATALLPQLQFRPQLFTFALLSILMAKLAAEVYRGPARLWPLIPMFPLWANLHAGCFVGLGVLGIVTIVLGLQELVSKGTISRAWSIAGVTLACALATLLNPFGWDPWRTFIDSIADPLIRPFISDWVPLTKFLAHMWHQSRYLAVLQEAVPLLLFTGFITSLILVPVLDDAPLVAIALIFIGAAFYANRNVALAVLALSIPFARHADLALRERLAEDFSGDAARGGFYPFLIMMAAAVVALAGGEFSTRLRTWEPVPSGAVAFMKTHRLHGNILNNFDWGEYLIWHLSPQSRVFIDGRYELVYPDALLREYLGFLFGWPGGEQLLDRYAHDFVLVKPQSGAYRLVAADSRWRVIYRDAVAALFARASAPSPDHAHKPMSDRATESEFP